MDGMLLPPDSYYDEDDFDHGSDSGNDNDQDYVADEYFVDDVDDGWDSLSKEQQDEHTDDFLRDQWRMERGNRLGNNYDEENSDDEGDFEVWKEAYFLDMDEADACLEAM